MPTFRLILFPTFLIVAGIMSGHLVDDQGESDYMLAGFGLGELTVAILSLSILHAFNGSMRLQFEDCYLQGDRKHLKVLLNQ